jgi:hypothetical protein
MYFFLSVVVVATSHVFVLQMAASCGRSIRGLLIESALKNRFDVFSRWPTDHPDAECALASGVQA